MTDRSTAGEKIKPIVERIRATAPGREYTRRINLLAQAVSDRAHLESIDLDPGMLYRVARKIATQAYEMLTDAQTVFADRECARVSRVLERQAEAVRICEKCERLATLYCPDGICRYCYEEAESMQWDSWDAYSRWVRAKGIDLPDPVPKWERDAEEAIRLAVGRSTGKRIE